MDNTRIHYLRHNLLECSKMNRKKGMRKRYSTIRPMFAYYLIRVALNIASNFQLSKQSSSLIQSSRFMPFATQLKAKSIDVAGIHLYLKTKSLRPLNRSAIKSFTPNGNPFWIRRQGTSLRRNCTLVWQTSAAPLILPASSRCHEEVLAHWTGSPVSWVATAMVAQQRYILMWHHVRKNHRSPARRAFQAFSISSIRVGPNHRRQL